MQNQTESAMQAWTAYWVHVIRSFGLCVFLSMYVGLLRTLVRVGVSIYIYANMCIYLSIYLSKICIYTYLRIYI